MKPKTISRPRRSIRRAIEVADAGAVERVEAKLADDLPGNTALGVAEMFAAFGDPTRLRLLYALAESELCVADLAAILGVSASAVSHQLRGLRLLRLVKYRRAGKSLIYALDDEHVRLLLQMGLEHARE